MDNQGNSRRKIPRDLDEDKENINPLQLIGSKKGRTLSKKSKDKSDQATKSKALDIYREQFKKKDFESLFKVNVPLTLGRFNRKIYFREKQRKVVLQIVKSNTNLSVINKCFVITENGIPSSLKTHNNDFISVGRQQINEQGIRPNDIMLFPTDPSISRSHFKIYHKEYFNKIKKFERQSSVFNLLNRNYLNSELLYDILKYIKPKPTIMIQDVGTIYGTYVKVRAPSLKNCLANLYLIIKKNLQVSNFDALSHFDEYRMFNTLNDNLLLENFASFNKEFLLRFLKPCIFEKLAGLELDLSPSQMLVEHNLILQPDSVFLCSNRSGFIIPRTGSFTKMMDFMGYDCHANNEVYNSHVYVISNANVLNVMKYDNYSKTYKLLVNKESFFNCKDELDKHTMAYFVELTGDPCGIMNRSNDIIFVYVSNSPCLEFNNIPGFLVGNDNTCSYIVESENYGFVYFFEGKWMITDLTRFLKPQVYYTPSYFGLWLCISPDKMLQHRWSSKMYEVRSGDEIKVSETVFALKMEVEN